MEISWGTETQQGIPASSIWWISKISKGKGGEWLPLPHPVPAPLCKSSLLSLLHLIHQILSRQAHELCFRAKAGDSTWILRVSLKDIYLLFIADTIIDISPLITGPMWRIAPCLESDSGIDRLFQNLYCLRHRKWTDVTLWVGLLHVLNWADASASHRRYDTITQILGAGLLNKRYCSGFDEFRKHCGVDVKLRRSSC